MILDTIIEKKKTTLEEELKRMLPREQGKIAKQMKLYDSLFVIGEIKKASPSKGVIVEDFSAARFANAYDEAGINAISILTERNFFQGGLENIEIARSVSDLPILRKDFIMDAREVVQTKRIGANMMLLIVAMLEDATLREFYQLARFLWSVSWRYTMKRSWSGHCSCSRKSSVSITATCIPLQYLWKQQSV